MKLFNWHNNVKKRNNYRPFYSGTWEPLIMDTRHLLPFQFHEDSSPSIFHVSLETGSATDITGYLSLDVHNTIRSYNGAMLSSAIPDGPCYFLSQGTHNYWTDDCQVMGGSDYLGNTLSGSDYFPSGITTVNDNLIAIKISSETDFGGTYYKGGWFQLILKRANILRSPRGKTVITGDEKNGELVKEKIITASKFTTTIKVTQPEFEGLFEALSGDWTMYDHSGRTYDCRNVEISDPDWHQVNGICRISFDDNISVFSLNNSNL